ncbi:MAG: hypothetical protein KY463_13725, partial [Actinobacteria bacterium]|nr:hypothetical protein [Actinomycetota bacterium]
MSRDPTIEPLGGETPYEGSQFSVRVERFRHADGEEVQRGGAEHLERLQHEREQLGAALAAGHERTALLTGEMVERVAQVSAQLTDGLAQVAEALAEDLRSEREQARAAADASPLVLRGKERSEKPPGGAKRWMAGAFLAPALLLLGAFVVYPTIDTIFQSVQSEEGSYLWSRPFIGFDNYAEIADKIGR